jgi:hypothetical protein
LTNRAHLYLGTGRMETGECAGYSIVRDVLLSGFGLQVTDRGLRNFLVERYIRGKAYRVAQGARPQVAPKEAGQY